MHFSETYVIIVCTNVKAALLVCFSESVKNNFTIEENKMKKRIISLILVIVMLALALVGCSTSLLDENLDDYASYDAAKLAEALKAITVKGGDFTDDVETRKNKVNDAIYSALASAVSDDTKKQSGKVGAHDLVFYCYYITYEKTVGEGESATTITVQSAPDYMETSKAVKIQLGQKIAYTNALSKYVFDKLSAVDGGFEFTAENAYSQNITATDKALAGQWAVISYKTAYTKAGSTVEEADTVTKQIVKLDAANPIHAALIDKTIGTKADAVNVAENSGLLIDGVVVNEAIKVTDAVVEYVIKGAELDTFTNTESTTKIKVKDVYGHEEEVEENKLVYHVYANAYTTVDEFNASNVIALVYGKNFTKEIAQNMFILGKELGDKTEDEKKAAIAAVSIVDGDSTITFDALVDKIVTALSDVSAKDTALTTAETNLSKATDENREELTEAVTTAETALAEAKKTRDNLLKQLVGSEGMNATLVKGYESIKYNELQDAYNKDIKEKIATEVFEIIKKNVTVNGAPKKAVDEAYDMLINNYKEAFYNDTAKDANGKEIKNEDGEAVTNYSYYMSGDYVKNGSFKVFLKDQVAGNDDIAKCYDGTVENYKDAKAALRAYAESTVVPVIQFTFVAEKLGLEYTDKEFKEYKKDKNNGYESDEYYYGESAVRNGLQFEKLMKALLEAEKLTKTEDARYVNYKYDNDYIKVTVTH